jgi:hypothetical protein
VKDRVEAGDIFGSALAAGQLGNGPVDDLAIGAQQEDVGPEGSEAADAGSVQVLYGSTSGLTATGNQRWSQDSSMVPGLAESGDGFGDSLRTGNFGRGPQDDLAVGASGEDGGAINSGVVHVIYGSQGGLTTTGNQAFVQGPGSGLQGAEDPGDFFGRALAAGNFGKSTHDDLAIGVFGETVEGFVQAGAVAVVYGSATGLRPAGNQYWAQTGNPDLLDASEDGDVFGKTLAPGNYGMDPHDDLAIGALFEDHSASQDGLVNVMYSDGSVLNAPGNQIWGQDSNGIEGEAEQDDEFGVTLG